MKNKDAIKDRILIGVIAVSIIVLGVCIGIIIHNKLSSNSESSVAEDGVSAPSQYDFDGEEPPEPPDGEMPDFEGEEPPELPDGEAPNFDGEEPPEPPDDETPGEGNTSNKRPSRPSSKTSSGS